MVPFVKCLALLEAHMTLNSDAPVSDDASNSVRLAMQRGSWGGTLGWHFGYLGSGAPSFQ